jgi:hypothetical protein
MQEFLCNETTTFLYNFLQNEWKDNKVVIKLFKDRDIYAQIQKIQKKTLSEREDMQMTQENIITLNKNVLSEMNNFFEFYAKKQMGNSKPKSILKATTVQCPQKELIHLFFNRENNFTVNMDSTLHKQVCIKTCSIDNLNNIHEGNNVFGISINDEKQEFKIPINNYSCEGLVAFVNKTLQKKKIEFIYNNEICKFCFLSKGGVFNLFLNKSLAELLGFKNESYISQDFYISDIEPKFDLFNNIFVQLTLGQQSFNFVKTNNKLQWYSVLVPNTRKKIIYEKHYIYINNENDNTMNISLYDNYLDKITCNFSINILLEFL